jgi:hypothetical protein
MISGKGMKARRLLISIAALAAFAPSVVGSGTANARGRLLPDLPQHLETAERDIRQGQLEDAIAHLDLVLMDHPLHYKLDVSQMSPERQAECIASFRDSTALWQRSFKDLKFVEVEKDQPAEITVTFQPYVKQQGNDVAGFVTWQRKVVGGVSGVPVHSELIADVRIRTVQPGGEPMLLEHMRHTSAHELGHVLGLDDSPFFGDIMGPLDIKHPVTEFEPTELENLRAVRAEAETVRAQAIARQPGSVTKE